MLATRPAKREFRYCRRPVWLWIDPVSFLHNAFLLIYYIIFTLFYKERWSFFTFAYFLIHTKYFFLACFFQMLKDMFIFLCFYLVLVN